jgi:hypothetical protein
MIFMGVPGLLPLSFPPFHKGDWGNLRIRVPGNQGEGYQRTRVPGKAKWKNLEPDNLTPDSHYLIA